jgi:acetyl/propionyl-CoA carboxylase alpha subunit
MDSTWKLDGEKVQTNHQATVVWEDARFFTIHLKNESFHGELIEEQLENRMIRIKINHREFVISKEGPLDQLIEELGLNKVKIRKLKQLKSPMPGRIVSVKSIDIQPNDVVDKGAVLISFE